MMSPGSWASSPASRWSSRSPQGSMRMTGPGFVDRSDSTASITGSGFMTIPGPPPNGMSSTCRWRSCVCSRRSCARSSTRPLSMARPITPCPKTGPNIAGKMVTTSNFISLVSSVVGFVDPQQPVRDHHAAARNIDLELGVFGGRIQVLDRTFTADPDIVGGPLQHLLDDADVGARLSHRHESHHLPVVETTLLQRPHLFVRDLEVPASKEVGHRPIVDPAQLDHQARLRLAAPLGLAVATLEHQARARAEAALEAAQGCDLDSTLDSKRPRDLTDSNHALTSPPDLRPRGAKCGGEESAGLARATETRLPTRSQGTPTNVRNAARMRTALPVNLTAA